MWTISLYELSLKTTLWPIHIQVVVLPIQTYFELGDTIGQVGLHCVVVARSKLERQVVQVLKLARLHQAELGVVVPRLEQRNVSAQQINGDKLTVSQMHTRITRDNTNGYTSSVDNLGYSEARVRT